MQQQRERDRSAVAALTGATGFVGRSLVRELLRRGWTVRCLARDADKARRTLPADGVEVIRGDVFERAAMEELADGAGAMIHLIGIRRERRREGVTFERMHVDATARALEAAGGAGVRRYLHMSALGTRPGGASEYHRTKWRAEGLVRDSGLDWTIFRPSLIHGADGEFMRMARGWATGTAPPFVFLPYFLRMEPGGLAPRPETPSVQPVAVGDVARAFCEALERAETVGETYPLGGSERLTWPEMLREIRDAAPAPSPLSPMGIPGDVAAMKARIAEALGLGGLLPFGESDAIMGSEDNVCSTEKVEAELGFRPSGFRESMRPYAGELFA